MKNVQVIDGALNATYSLFALTDADFRALFPEGQDIAFADEVWARLGDRAGLILERAWKRPVWKPAARGIHGTLLFGLEEKKQWYPGRREVDVEPSCLNPAQRRLYRRMKRGRRVVRAR